MNALIWNAASMFFASPTGRQQRGEAAVRALAGRVVNRLKHEIVDDEVAFCKTDAATAGFSRKGRSGWFRNNIVVSNRYANDLTATSLILVHEATHLTMSRTLIEEELWCRTMECYYLDDLTFSTARWDYPTHGGRRAAAAKFNPVGHPSPYLRDKVEEWTAFAGDQLLDYILKVKEYSDSLEADWVRENIDVYGGIANRTRETKDLYIKVLARSGGVEDARLILKILQSVPARNRAEWVVVTGGIGGMATVRKGLAPLRRPGGGTALEVQAIQRLEAQWHDPL